MPSESTLGRIPIFADYLVAVGVLGTDSEYIYTHLNFDPIEEYVVNAKQTTA